jgi:hypothetical protein
MGSGVLCPVHHQQQLALEESGFSGQRERLRAVIRPPSTEIHSLLSIRALKTL